jgi:mono/diheme cytochrome c family protein
LTIAIGRPVYLAIADDASIRHTIEEGTPGTPMPAFAQSAGGMLTAAQVEILVSGIRRWARPGDFDPRSLPALISSHPGNASRGREIFTASCASCHGPDGQGARAIAVPAYLSVVTDQHLRTVMIAGMPDLGMPDWRGHNKPLSDDEITDVVAWLAAQREQFSTQVTQ